MTIAIEFRNKLKELSGDVKRYEELKKNISDLDGKIKYQSQGLKKLEVTINDKKSYLRDLLSLKSQTNKNGKLIEEIKTDIQFTSEKIEKEKTKHSKVIHSISRMKNEKMNAEIEKGKLENSYREFLYIEKFLQNYDKHENIRLEIDNLESIKEKLKEKINFDIEFRYEFHHKFLSDNPPTASVEKIIFKNNNGIITIERDYDYIEEENNWNDKKIRYLKINAEGKEGYKILYHILKKELVKTSKYYKGTVIKSILIPMKDSYIAFSVSKEDLFEDYIGLNIETKEEDEDVSIFVEEIPKD